MTAKDTREIVFFYIPFPNIVTAVRTGKELLRRRLIGCYNISRVRSAYWWEGEITTDSEYVVIAKTLPELEEKVREVISSLHPYTVPCIATFKVSVNESYFQWLKNEVESTTV